MRTRENLVAGGDDRRGLLLFQPAKLAVRFRARLLDTRIGADELGVSALSRDRKVLDRPGGLRSPVSVVGDLPHAEAVLLFSQGLSPIRSRWEEVGRSREWGESDAVLRPTFSVLRPPASTPFATLAECNRTCRSAQRRALELERVETQVSRRIWKRPGSLALAIVLAASFAAACHRQASRPIPEARSVQSRFRRWRCSRAPSRSNTWLAGSR